MDMRVSRTGKLASVLETILASSVLALAISPPYALLIVAVVLVGLVWEGRAGRRAQLAGAIAVVVVGIFALILTIGAWQEVTDRSPNNPIALVAAWISDGTKFELYKLERGSGWVQQLFGTTPEWAHIPMATGNGLVQPFLPATLMDATSLPLPRVIGIVARPWLVYLAAVSTVCAIRSTEWRRMAQSADLPLFGGLGRHCWGLLSASGRSVGQSAGLARYSSHHKWLWQGGYGSIPKRSKARGFFDPE